MAEMERLLGGAADLRTRLTSQLEDLQGQNADLTAANADLQTQIEVATAELEEKQAQLASAAKLRTELQSQIDTTSEALNAERAGRESDVNRLSAGSADLQEQLAGMLGLRDEAVNTLALRDGEVNGLSDKIVTLEGELATVQEANASALEESAKLEQQIAALNSELETTVASVCLLYTSPSPRDRQKSRMPSSA